MELKPGYKRTEVGVIPEEWESATIRGLASSARNAIVGGPFGSELVSRDYVEHGVPVIRGQNMNGQWLSGNFVFVTPAKAKSLEANLARPGDIVFTQRGTLGQVSLVPGKPFESYLVSQSQMKLSVNREVADPLFFFYVFTSKKQQELIRGSTIQTGVPHINLGILRDIPVHLPPLPEQRAIAEALSDVDELIGALDQLIVKKRDIKQATMQQLLTGQTRLPGFSKGIAFQTTSAGQLPKDWSIAPLKSISTMNGRIGWQGLKQEEFTSVESDPFLITGMNFKDGRIRWDEVYHIPEKRYEEAKPIQLRGGDILMTKDGTIGKLLFVETIPLPGKASLNSHLLVFRPLNGCYVPKFFFYQLRTKRFANYVDLNKSGTTFFGITQEAVGKYEAYLPSIHEQTAIATVLSDMDAELTALEQRRDKTRALKQGMMQELLTGRIRLPLPRH